MSDRVHSRERGDETDLHQASAAAKRAAIRAAAAREARAQRWQQARTGVVIGFILVAVAVVALVKLDPDPPVDNASGVTPTASESAGPEGDAAPVDPNFPPLPPGADPVLRERPKVTAGSGELTKLGVTTIVEGTGPAVVAGQTVTVNFVGVLYKTGQQFGTSWDRAQTAEFLIGANRNIPGWDQGLVGVKVGSRVQLDIPSDLAFGDNPEAGTPAGPLRFVVDVLAVR